MDLEKNFPTVYFSKYSMVTFNAGMGYDEAMRIGRAQDKALLNMIADKDISTSMEMTKEELEIVLQKVQKQTRVVLQEDKIAGL